MGIERFALEPDDRKPVHSSGYAKAAFGDNIGSTSSQAFDERARIDNSREHVGRYRDSRVVMDQLVYRKQRKHPAKSPKRSAPRPEPTKRTQPNPETPTPHTFKEPPKRTYDPYA